MSTACAAASGTHHPRSTLARGYVISETVHTHQVSRCLSLAPHQVACLLGPATSAQSRPVWSRPNWQICSGPYRPCFPYTIQATTAGTSTASSTTRSLAKGHGSLSFEARPTATITLSLCPYDPDPDRSPNTNHNPQPNPNPLPDPEPNPSPNPKPNAIRPAAPALLASVARAVGHCRRWRLPAPMLRQG